MLQLNILFFYITSYYLILLQVSGMLKYEYHYMYYTYKLLITSIIDV